jgi:HSP20 family protein
LLRGAINLEELTMNIENLKETFDSMLDSIADGWRHLRNNATSALTRFKPGASTSLPAREDVDDQFYLPDFGWAMLGGDMFEDERRLVVRIEVPGIPKENIDIELTEQKLVISGEKKFERESSQGRWRLMQCAYGNFRREIPLPVAVKTDDAKATYKNGVLRVELPKLHSGKLQGFKLKVE